MTRKIEEMPDPYTSCFAGQPDSHGYRNPAFRDARRILALPDSAIQELPPRKSGLRTFVIEGATVSWPHGVSRRFNCWTHNVQKCSHTKRVARFVEGK